LLISKDKDLQSDIKELQEKTKNLREKTKNNTNVFDEIRLKSLLNDLKQKLEENSEVVRQIDEQQKAVEQKTLSLISLYNDHIETSLKGLKVSSDAKELDRRIDELSKTIQKRNDMETLLKKYQPRESMDNVPPISSISNIERNDKDSLQLNLDLYRDRKKDIEDKLEKWTLEQDEVCNELKLQEKMQEFLENIQKINEDSDFPKGSIKRSDLEGVVGKNHGNKLSNRLIELQANIDHGKILLTQIIKLIEKVQNEIANLNVRKK
jgi:DNA repair exonuclease SbcCD ATPase subunit